MRRLLTVRLLAPGKTKFRAVPFLQQTLLRQRGVGISAEIPNAKLAQPTIINLEIDGRFVQARLSEAQPRNLDADRYAPIEEDETATLVMAVAALEGRAA